jgi:hypothetical protein
VKIANITATNYIGARSIDLQLTKPIVLVAGRNASGKSSLRDGIRHALTGEPTRVALKKDYSDLVTDGQKTGVVIVDTNLGKAGVVLPSGKQTASFDVPQALPYVLDAQRFARLAPNGRRAFLFGLFGFSADGDAVRAALAERGCNPANIAAVMPLLRAGFEAACDEAKAKARDAKVQWRAVTGETYGSQKALAWRATKPSFDETKLKHARAVVEESDRALAENNAKLGALMEQQRAQTERAAKLAGLRQCASQYARWADKLAVDEASLAEWEATVEKTQAAASGVPYISPLTCPDCGSELTFTDGHLKYYVAPDKIADKEAAEKLPSYIKARDLLKRSVENAIAQRDDAESAARAIAEIDDDKTPLVTEDEIAAVKAKIQTIKQHRAAVAADISTLERTELNMQTADAITARAAEHHADIDAWERIADALAPDGIPGQILQSALGPINARIDESAQFCGWLPIRIDPDMNIISGERDYRMLSESEQYRADAMIAEAVSHISGAKLLVLDRVDVLDPAGRADLLAWLAQWADGGDIETAILFATLKERPLIQDDLVNAVWLENGIIAAGETT